MHCHRSPALALSLLCLPAAACFPDIKYCIGDCPHASGGTGTSSDTDTDTDTAPEPATTGAPLATCELVDTIATPATCMDQIHQPGELCFLIGTVGTQLPQGVDSTLPLRITDEHLPGLALARGDGGNEAQVFTPGPAISTSTIDWGPLPVQGPVRFTGSGDLDTDGIPDIISIIAADDDHAILSYLSPDGEILGTEPLLISPEIHGAHVVDFDGDGDDDVVLIADIESNEHNFILYRNKGGGLASIEPLFGRTFVSEAHDVGALGLDGREDDHVFAAPGGGVDVQIVGPGDTIFTVALDPGMAVRALEIADLDEDGRGDFVALVDDTTHGTTSVAVGLQTTDDLGDPTFGVTHHAVHCGALAMAVGDIDADGHLDVVTVGPQAPASVATLRIGDGAGGLPGLMTVPIGEDADTVHIVDLNGDGAPDLATSSRAAGAVSYTPSTP